MWEYICINDLEITTMTDQLTKACAYIAAHFTSRFPNAKEIIVDWDDENETWNVLVDDALWQMQVGSDDDAFYFYGPALVGVEYNHFSFPLMQE